MKFSFYSCDLHDHTRKVFTIVIIMIAMSMLNACSIGDSKQSSIPEKEEDTQVSSTLMTDTPEISKQVPSSSTSSVPGGETQSAAAPQEKSKIIGIADECGYGYNSTVGFDYLEVDLKVHIQEAGTINIYTDLYTMEGKLIDFGTLLPGEFSIDITYKELPSGESTVAVYFDGPEIRKTGVNGPYKIRARIRSGKNLLDEGEFTTASHKYKDFRTYSENEIDVSGS